MPDSGTIYWDLFALSLLHKSRVTKKSAIYCVQKQDNSLVFVHNSLVFVHNSLVFVHNSLAFVHNNYLLFYYVGAHTIGVLQNKLVRAFPIEAGHFNQSEKVIPDCPGECTATIRTEMNAFFCSCVAKINVL